VAKRKKLAPPAPGQKARLTPLDRAALGPMRSGRRLVNMGGGYGWAVLDKVPKNNVFVWWKTAHRLIDRKLVEPADGKGGDFAEEWTITAAGLGALGPEKPEAPK
jgi:hypothetical protein